MVYGLALELVIFRYHKGSKKFGSERVFGAPAAESALTAGNWYGIIWCKAL